MGTLITLGQTHEEVIERAYRNALDNGYPIFNPFESYRDPIPFRQIYLTQERKRFIEDDENNIAAGIIHLLQTSRNSQKSLRLEYLKGMLKARLTFEPGAFIDSVDGLCEHKFVSVMTYRGIDLICKPGLRDRLILEPYFHLGTPDGDLLRKLISEDLPPRFLRR